MWANTSLHCVMPILDWCYSLPVIFSTIYILHHYYYFLVYTYCAIFSQICLNTSVPFGFITFLNMSVYPGNWVAVYTLWYWYALCTTRSLYVCDCTLAKSNSRRVTRSEQHSLGSLGPNPQSMVPGTCAKGRPIWRNSKCAHTVLMSEQDWNSCAFQNVPNIYGIVIIATKQ